MERGNKNVGEKRKGGGKTCRYIHRYSSKKLAPTHGSTYPSAQPGSRWDAVTYTSGNMKGGISWDILH